MFSERIKTLRLSYNLNQVELAKKLNVSKQCISNWENDNIQPSVDMLEHVANFFEVSTDFLLGRDNANTINVDGLTLEEVSHIKLIIQDIRNKNKN